MTKKDEDYNSANVSSLIKAVEGTRAEIDIEKLRKSTDIFFEN